MMKAIMGKLGKICRCCALNPKAIELCPSTHLSKPMGSSMVNNLIIQRCFSTKNDAIEKSLLTHSQKDFEIKLTTYLNHINTNCKYYYTKTEANTSLRSECQEILNSDIALSVECNQLLKQVNDLFVKYNHHEYILLNKAHADYLQTLLVQEMNSPNLMYYFLYSRKHGILKEGNSISIFDKYTTTAQISEILLMIKLANDVEKSRLESILYDKLTNYNDKDAVEINTAIYFDKIRNKNIVLLKFISKDCVYNYLDKLLKSVVIDHSLQLSTEQKFQLAYNLLNHKTAYTVERVKLIIECINLLRKNKENSSFILWKNLQSIYTMVFYSKNELDEFNEFCKQCVDNPQSLTLHEQIMLITFLVRTNHRLMQYPPTQTFINNALQKPISELITYKRGLLRCYKANKVLFENTINNIMGQLALKTELSDADQIDVLFYYINSWQIKHSPLIIKSFQLINKESFKFMKMILDDSIYYIHLTNFELIDNMSASNISYVLSQFCTKFNLIYYQADNGLFKLTPITHVIDNPQLIAKVIDNNTFDDYHTIKAVLGIYQKQNCFKDQLLKNLLDIYTICDVASVLYSIMLCKDGVITALDIKPYFEFYKKEYPEYGIPLLLYFSHFFNLNLYSPSSFQNIFKLNHIQRVIVPYCLVRPYLDSLSNIEEYDKVFLNLINKTPQRRLFYVLLKMIQTFGNSNYHKPTVKHIINKRIKNSQLKMQWCVNFKCYDANIMKILLRIKISNSLELKNTSKLVSYWGDAYDYNTLLSTIMGDPIIDIEGNKLFQTFCKGKNSDILFYLLNIPVVREYLLQNHKETITKCLQQSQNWNLFMHLYYTLNNPIAIDANTKIQLVSQIEKAQYINQCMTNDEFNKNIQEFQLSSQISAAKVNDDLSFPYYCKEK